MSFFTPANLRTAAAGRWCQRSDVQVRLAGVGIDTRESLSGRAFIAIRGEVHDGHAFLSQAVEAGARMLIVEEQPDLHSIPDDVFVLVVPDTRQCLLRMAATYRATLSNTRVICVTGSCGKTTTKHLIDSILKTALRGSTAPKSFNNEIGVPLSILAAKQNDQYLVLEIGTNAPGEVGRLAAAAKPNIAVITSISRAHLEGLGSIDAICREKASLLNHLASGGMAIVNTDEPGLEPYLRAVPTMVRYGLGDAADIRLSDRGPRGCGQWFQVNGRSRYEMELAGRHNALNAMAAIAVARRVGLSDEVITAALADVQPLPMRSETTQWGGVTIVNDAYNANPDSMLASLEAFAETSAESGRRVLVLGDMLELGPEAAELHAEVGGAIVELDDRVGINFVVLVGPLMAHAAKVVRETLPAERVRHHGDLESFDPGEIPALLRPGDAVLLKGSRRIGLERVAEAIRARFEVSGESAQTPASEVDIKTGVTRGRRARAGARE